GEHVVLAGILFGRRVAGFPAAPRFIANTPYRHVPRGRATIGFPQVGQRRLSGIVAVFEPAKRFEEVAGSHVDADEGLCFQSFAQRQELVGAELVILFTLAPEIIWTYRALVTRADAFLPAINVVVVAAKANHRNAHLAQRGNDGLVQVAVLITYAAVDDTVVEFHVLDVLPVNTRVNFAVSAIGMNSQVCANRHVRL